MVVRQVPPLAEFESRALAVAMIPQGMAALLGVAVAMALVGLSRRFLAIEADSIPSRAEVVGGALIALAVGVRLPHGLATWMCAHTWRRLTARSVEPGSTTPNTPAILRGTVERPLRFLVVSTTALAAGIATALTPVTTEFVCAGHAWMVTNFFWLPVPLAILRMATALAAAALPFMLLGLSVSCAHHLICRFGQWDTKATAWVLVGGAIGFVICSLFGGAGSKPNVLIAAAALPSLLVALSCAVSGTSRGQSGQGDSAVCLPPPPAWSDRWPALLRAAIVAVAAGLAVVVCSTGSWLAGTVESAVLVAALAVSGLGAGMAAGSRAKRNGLRSIGGFGVACTGAGGVLAATSFVLQDGVGGSLALSMSSVWLSVAAGGCAVAYGHQALLHRVGNRSAVGATTLARMLVAAGLIAWLGAPALHALIQTSAVVAIVSLSFLAVGGMLIIHEPTYSARTRRVRLCAVFGLIAAMITAVKFVPHRPVVAATTATPESVTHTSAALVGGYAEPASQGR